MLNVVQKKLKIRIDFSQTCKIYSQQKLEKPYKVIEESNNWYLQIDKKYKFSIYSA